MNKLGFYTKNFGAPGVIKALKTLKPPVLLTELDDFSILEHIRNEWSPETFVIGRFFVVQYSDDIPGELRRTEDGTVVAQLSGSLTWVGIYDTGGYLFIHHRNDRTEVWNTQDQPYLLTQFEDSETEDYAAKQQRLIETYRDGSAYLVDLGWLAAMGGYPLELTGEDLIEAACIPFAKEKNYFTKDDEDELVEEYLKPLGIQKPQACQE